MQPYQNPSDQPTAANEPSPADEIRKTFRTFVLSRLTEVRIIGSPQGICSGYFNDPDRLIAALKQLGRLRHAQVYFLPNPPLPALLNRAANRFELKPKSTTSDKDVVRRDWFLIDLDPVRPPDISATDEEHQAAIERALEIRDYLITLGFTDAVIGDSGNGAHLACLINLANDAAATRLVQRVLEALAFKFSDQVVKVDLTTFNAARIWKLYGTIAKKGDDTHDTPHRRARLLEVPDPLRVVPKEALEQLAALAPPDEPRRGNNQREAFDLEGFIARNSIGIARQGPWKDGWRYIPCVCPWNPEQHTNQSAFIIRFASGAIAAGCRHESCTGKGWKDLRELFEPAYRERRQAKLPHDTDRGEDPRDGPGGARPAPMPLHRPLADAEQFPVAALGQLLGGAVEAIHEKIGAPRAIIANSVLATATLAVQPFANVQLPTGQVRPINEYFVTIAATGERKSASDEEAITAVRTYEKQLAEEYEELQSEHRLSHAAWTKQRDQILGDKTNPTIETKKAALACIGEEPQPPLLPMRITTEPTLEGLHRLFREGYPSLGIMSGEGGQFIGGHAMQEDARLRTAAGLSDLWDGNSIKRSRAGDGNYALFGRRLTMHLLVQPLVADLLFADPLLADQGLLSRILAVRPESASGTRSFREISSANFSHLSHFSQGVGVILMTPASMVGGKRNELDPRSLTLDSEARQLWIRFVDYVETEMGTGRAWESIRGLANKLGEHAARLAAVLTLIDDLTATTISASTLAAAINLARYYAGELLRIRDSSQVGEDLANAERLLKWLQTEWRETASGNRIVSLPDVYQCGPRPIRDRATAQKLIAILEEHGWLKRAMPASINGTPRREVWSIVR